MTRKWQIGDDVLDTRDIEDRISELGDFEEELNEAREEYLDLLENSASSTQEEIDEASERHQSAVEYFPTEEQEELRMLRDFKLDVESYCEWEFGEAMIHERYKTAYAEQVAEDIGAINRNNYWPHHHIDWEAAAKELFDHDYHSADLGAHTYYMRMS